MVGKFPSGFYGTWKECVTRYNYIRKGSLLRKAQLLANIAIYDESQGRFDAVYLQCKDILQIMESNLGKTHLSTVATQNQLAVVLNKQGKYTGVPIH